ncbi:peptidoglycan-binding protein [Streptomyces sp. Ncost-T10-10d]|uniref:peptidoglycan-binding domain-containing protein n=1 Tax=Streptomyces sp. Ncost-T10-10d TaxID=1839774 RepID=UPI00081F1956|nr:peptidoglycan-binding domain-containing protein [Streptomyces sp. Ncost-T10-10d]SCF56944.1 Putative peptidoglycan binding domain-containing protein [Streptomyces sp. Ncost-T10-10d]
MKRTLAALTTLAAAAGGILVGAPAASAADGYCTTSSGVTQGAYWTSVPTTSGGSTSCVMGPGSSGAGVDALQAALILCYGMDVGGRDGVYGAKTEAAVRSLQRATGQTADGIYGPNTRNVVEWRWYTNPGAKCDRL